MNSRIITSGAFVLVLAASAFAGQPPQDLHTQAKIAEADARATALQKVPDGTIASSELEKEHGKLIWSFDIKRPNSKDITEVQVDAKTGAIVSTQVESPADQVREAAADAKPHVQH
ncbi:PepSY domain-containing protein [Dokdonella soli]|uniref:PepSY domain-containing protein n=1 Tax=Dokdonella soli TaxID=529810 RepID=A0ABN1IXF5_9GAMM